MTPTEYLTYDEIKARFPDQWLAIAEYDSDPRTTDVAGGRVVAASPDRKELRRLLSDLPRQRLAIRCTRPWPKDLVLVPTYGFIELRDERGAVGLAGPDPSGERG